MNFVDATLVKLADPATRSQLFDATALGQILAAAYDVDRIGPVAGTLEALFDEVEVGVVAGPSAVIDGVWSQIGGTERSEARLSLDGVGPPLTRVEGFWRGSILARTALTGEAVEAVSVDWPRQTTIDAAVAAANGGALPGAAAALETARRAELLAELKASAPAPAAMTSDRVDALLGAAGVASVKELFELNGRGRSPAVVQLRYEPPRPVSQRRRLLPVAAALLVRDLPLSIADLVVEAKAARRRLRALGYEARADAELAMLNALVVVLVVPRTLFDDPDWPGGADAAARRAAAGEWLAREGLGLAAVAA